jgi:phosphoenolpyruvate carboxylase
MAVVQHITTDPGEIEEDLTVTTRTRIILEAIDKLDSKLNDMQDVSEAVREIQRYLGVNNHWRKAIIRALRHFVSLIDPKP